MRKKISDKGIVKEFYMLRLSLSIKQKMIKNIIFSKVKRQFMLLPNKYIGEELFSLVFMTLSI